jgi:hypothetical protein
MACATPPWDSSKADTLLRSFEFSELDKVLRESLDVYRHCECVDWMSSRAEQGHVIVLYHVVRNASKFSASSSSYRTMSTSEFNGTFRNFMLLLLRTVQDAVSVAIIMGQSPRHDIYELLRNKIYSWLAQQYNESRWPEFSNTLAQVAESQCATDVHSLPLPVWILSTNPGAFASLPLPLSHAIYFNTPEHKIVEACTRTIVPLNDERARVTRTFLQLLRTITWPGLKGIAITAFQGNPGVGGGAEGSERVAGAEDVEDVEDVER